MFVFFSLNISREKSRQEAENLLNRICDLMQSRTPKTDVAQAREDTSQIQSYFRSTGVLKTGDNDFNLPIEVVNREIDLRLRDINEHKCTIIFNKQLKIGGGVRDRLKKTAKIRAYEQLKYLTRNTPRDNLILKRTKDHLWTAVIKSSNTK